MGGIAGSFVAVDWGTTNRRAWRVADGHATSLLSDDRGILAVTDFAAAVADVQARAPGLPLLMAGMIGSNRGWREVPYVPAPATLTEIAAAVDWVEPEIGIVPGVSFADGALADIMRGEEVQLLGACALAAVECDGLVCHPGTHTKWAEMEGGAIARFRTVMTGDLFAALQHKSILTDLLAHAAPVDAAFLAGVDHALANSDLTAELFAVRARVVLGLAEARHAASYVSGLLIGTDVRTGLGRVRADVVPVLGAPALTARFAAALARAGRHATEHDGDAAFIAGMTAIAGAL
ncbi:MAG: 2-dehydro-3-deoxygalactonokinase [Sphingomonadaceae bacterium]|nr:2-dehydro-3-deoxygalactonokinase [Sphingomonadaceae bacterium]